MKRTRKTSILFIALTLILSAFAAFPASAATGILELKVNFQENPERALAANEDYVHVVPEGYLPDYGEVFGDRGNGFTYGWDVDHYEQGRSHGTEWHDDWRYSSLMHFDWSSNWQIEVPNGEYEVYYVVGDAKYGISNPRGGTQLWINGVHAVEEQSLQVNEFIDGTVTVTVDDGRIILENGLQQVERLSKINFIHITSVGEVELPAGYGGEPADEEPADEEPADEEPADEEPADEEPADEEPADEEPADEEVFEYNGREYFVDDEGSVRWSDSNNLVGLPA